MKQGEAGFIVCSVAHGECAALHTEHVQACTRIEHPKMNTELHGWEWNLCNSV
jgi:hypothetical protein